MERGPECHYRLLPWGACSALSIGDGTPARESVHQTPAELVALIALANAALPDADPRKLMSHDLEWVESLRAASTSRQERDWLVGFAAKLRALLPPVRPAPSARDGVARSIGVIPITRARRPSHGTEESCVRAHLWPTSRLGDA